MSEQSNNPADEMRRLLEDLIEDYDCRNGRAPQDVCDQARDAMRRYDESKKAAPQNLQIEKAFKALDEALTALTEHSRRTGATMEVWGAFYEARSHANDLVKAYCAAMNDRNIEVAKSLRLTMVRDRLRGLLSSLRDSLICPCQKCDSIRGAIGAALAPEEDYQVCNKCGRKTWAQNEFNNICRMTQPNGEKCAGLFN